MRYLDSRIALLIQNRMALDEVSNMKKMGGQAFFFGVMLTHYPFSSKTRWFPIWKNKMTMTTVIILTTEKCSNTETCSSCCKANHDILRRCVDWSVCLRSILCFKPSCLPCTVINTRAEKSICCSPCSR